MISCLREPLERRPSTHFSVNGLRDWEREQKGRVFWYATGRAALFQALQALDLGGRAKVLLPAYIAAGVIEPIRALGLQVLFYETGPDLLITPKNVQLLIRGGGRIRAWVVIHPMGRSQPLDAIRVICRKEGILLIEDCAQAIGCSDRDGRALGTTGDIVLYSFTKYVGFAEGAAVVLRNPALPAPGSKRVRPREMQAAVRWYRKHLLMNRAAHRAADVARATRLLAASGRFYDRYYKLIAADFRPLRLEPTTERLIREFRWPELAQRRRENVTRLYRESRLNSLEWVFPKDAPGWVPFAVPARVTSGDRKGLVARALKQGVFLASLCGLWNFFPPGAGFENEKEYFANHVLVPINEHLSEEEMRHLIEVLGRL
jgi:hypothetical protein